MQLSHSSKNIPKHRKQAHKSIAESAIAASTTLPQTHYLMRTWQQAQKMTRAGHACFGKAWQSHLGIIVALRHLAHLFWMQSQSVRLWKQLRDTFPSHATLMPLLVSAWSLQAWLLGWLRWRFNPRSLSQPPHYRGDHGIGSILAVQTAVHSLC